MAVFGDQVAALRLRIEELDEAAMAAPRLGDLPIGALPRVDVAQVDGEPVHGAVGEAERPEQIARGAFAEGNVLGGHHAEG